MSKIIKAYQVIGEYEILNVDNNINESIVREGDPTSNTCRERDIQNEEQKQQANEIITEARKKAKKIIKEAKQEKELVEKIKSEAYKKGLRKGKKEGFEHGYKQGLEEVEEYKDVLKNVTRSYKEETEEIVNEFKAQLIKLATKIAGILVNYNLDVNPKIINSIVKDLLEELGKNHQKLVIRVHPEMIHYLEKDKISEEFHPDTLKFLSDNSLQKGDCVIETNFGGKDAIITDKLELLTERLYEEAGLHFEI